MSVPKICVITAARSEYGLLRWLIDELNLDKDIELQLVVTGAHLSNQFGYTIDEIVSDGYPIAAKVDMELKVDSTANIAKSMGLCGIRFAEVFKDLNPDIIVVLGDRYELLPICSTAIIMNIPIAHISGGDVTEGAIDDQIRNAVSMMSAIHFPGVEDSSENLSRMCGSENIFVVGEPGLENFKRLKLMNREMLSQSLGLDFHKQWVLVTQHPETKLTIDLNLDIIHNLINGLKALKSFEFIITKANADPGGNEINQYFESICNEDKHFKLFSSLGQLRYLSLINEVAFVIGNSSSGIVEAPFCGTPVINIGNRQKGRYISSNIINVSGFDDSITDAINILVARKNDKILVKDNYYGDGNTAIKIKNIIKTFLKNE